ncbi:MAG TPA: serine hydrolase domain-containing protein [Bryobacteraceae bacterium]|nr:serine hydrolase domain-containing protein [Bryobacteraceae bacterium]
MILTVFAQLMLVPGSPTSVGMSGPRLEAAASILESEVKDRSLGAASILVARQGKIILQRSFGRLSSKEGSATVAPDSVFLLASITKPVTACALMLLVERGKVSLSDPVSRYLPEFTGDDRARIRVRDLLAHTSGLPDMLPENTELRRANVPLKEFVLRAYKTPLLYPPGTSFRYQSMGTLLAGEIVERVSGMRLRDFEKKEIFEPLGMNHSSLGLGSHEIPGTVEAWTSPNADQKDTARFGSNSAYWRDMGHPWGGMHSTTRDLAVLLQMFLNGGVYDGKRIFSRATVKAMTTDQNSHLQAPWGLGWALGRSIVWNFFGDLSSVSTFGHAGATGTVAWADPETQLICVILTDRLLEEGRLLRLISNAVVASIEN